MKKYIIVELMCVVFAIVFIVSSVRGEEHIALSSTEIIEQIAADECAELISRDREYVREKLGFDPSCFSSFLYYSSDDIMNVNEIFIGVSPENTASDIKENIEKYRSEKYVLFDGYAPEEAALLNAARIEIKGNVLLFTVSENADEIYSAFISLY